MNFNKLDEFDPFVFRTTGFNSIRTLAARLSYYHAASNGLLSCLPLQLILRGKSTTQSYRQPVYYVDLTLRDGISLNEAIIQAKQIDEQSKQAGFYQEALDFTARKGFGNGRMEVDMEEGLDVVEEFYQGEEQLTDLVRSDLKVWNNNKSDQKEKISLGIQQNLQKSVEIVK